MMSGSGIAREGAANLTHDRHPLQTLEQLENEYWGEPTFDSYLVKEIHRLRPKPIGDFTIEDVRIALGQEIGVEHLAPLALERLEADPLAEGHMYPGDLLVSVLRLPETYWSTHPNESRRMAEVAERVTRELKHLDVTDEIKGTITALLAAAPRQGRI
jgi:hypothetical protein